MLRPTALERKDRIESYVHFIDTRRRQRERERERQRDRETERQRQREGGIDRQTDRCTQIQI